MTEISYTEMVEMLASINRQLDMVTACVILLADSQDFTIKETIKARIEAIQKTKPVYTPAISNKYNYLFTDIGQHETE